MLKNAFCVPVFPGQLLDVVDDQHVDHLVEVDEVGNLAVLVGRLELRLELVHRDVQHLQLRVALAHLVPIDCTMWVFPSPESPYI